MMKFYLVMELVQGKELFDKIVERGQYSEKDAAHIVRQILSAVEYLHKNDIAHRDLKPENLLLVKPKDPTEIVITDFGLSKFAAPHEAMKAACGTLSYVAPEVLKMEGYGKEVDLWSVGIILFLVLRAKLPFHDQTKNKIIARILRQNVQMVDSQWQKISNEAKDLIKKLLKKNPKSRITVEQAMLHPWFELLKKMSTNKTPKITDNTNIKQITNNIGDNIINYQSGPSIQMLRQESVRE